MKGKYNTEQRTKILKYLINHSDTYVKIEDIANFMKDNNENVGLTTIYRFLKILEEKGELRVEVSNNTKYFQYILDDCKDHYHLKCENCGKLIHFKCMELNKLNEHISKTHNFHINYTSVIYGMCNKCSN